MLIVRSTSTRPDWCQRIHVDPWHWLRWNLHTGGKDDNSRCGAGGRSYKGVTFSSDGCQKHISWRRPWRTSIYGPVRYFSFGDEQISGVLTKEVTLQPQTSLMSLELQYQAMIAKDGVYGIEIWLFSIHLERSEGSGVHIALRGGPGLHWPSPCWNRLGKVVVVGCVEMKDLGDLHYFLGVEVIHILDSILLNQRHYVLNMLYKFGMMDCR